LNIVLAKNINNVSYGSIWYEGCERVELRRPAGAGTSFYNLWNLIAPSRIFWAVPKQPRFLHGARFEKN